MTMPNVIQNTEKLRLATRAVNFLMGMGGGTDAQLIPTHEHFIAYVVPLLMQRGYTAVLSPTAAYFEIDGLEKIQLGVVGRYALQDNGQQLVVDFQHDGERGTILRSWIKDEAAGLDLRSFFTLAA